MLSSNEIDFAVVYAPKGLHLETNTSHVVPALQTPLDLLLDSLCLFGRISDSST